MTEKDLQLLSLLNGETSLQKLREETGLNNYQLAMKLRKLKNCGYLIERSFYEDSIYYFLSKKLSIAHSNFSIITNSPTFRFLAISDTHFGSTFDDFTKLDKIYHYAINHNIHNIFHLGDLIEGTKYPERNRLATVEEQLRCVVRDYPRDDGICNYILLGNHDKYSITKEGLDISKFLFDRRLDFVFLGYQKGCIHIYDSDIFLFHKHLFTAADQPYSKTKLILKGHYHKSEILKDNNRILNVLVPSLSLDSCCTFVKAFDITLLNSFDEVLL